MREILFRGKRTKTGEWVTGSLWHHTEKASLIYSNELDNKTWVLPKTVGQFTGMTDKNGKKIFEGDIVKAERICNGLYWTGCVVWWHGCFAIQGIKDSNNVPAIDLFRNYEVIGNIHDNPEL